MDELEDIDTPDALVRAVRERLGVRSVVAADIEEGLMHVRATSCDPSLGPGPVWGGGSIPVELTITKHLLGLDVPLIIEEVHSHPLVRQTPSLGTFGIASYLGMRVPLPGCTRTIFAFHIHKRRWSQSDIDLVEAAARRSAELGPSRQAR